MAETSQIQTFTLQLAKPVGAGSSKVARHSIGGSQWGGTLVSRALILTKEADLGSVVMTESRQLGEGGGKHSVDQEMKSDPSSPWFVSLTES